MAKRKRRIALTVCIKVCRKIFVRPKKRRK